MPTLARAATLTLLLAVVLTLPAPAAAPPPPLSGDGALAPPLSRDGGQGAAPGQGAASSAPTDSPGAARPSAPDLYAAAVRHLREGHWYEDAITHLRECVRQDPQNVSYHLALGCADADRAASISHAAAFTQRLKQAQDMYADSLARWQKAHEDPKSAQYDPKSRDYGAPPPVPPPALRFAAKDDFHYLRLTDAQALVRIRDLGTAAMAEWEKARALAKTPAGQAEAAYTQAWGRELLWKAWARGPEVKTPPPSDKAANDAYDGIMQKVHDEDIAAMQDATAAAPNNPVYWQSLGDLYKGDALSRPTSAMLTGDRPADAATAYEKSLALKPRNTPLWYRLAAVQFERAPDKALAALRKAMQSDMGNAYPHYLTAVLLFGKTNYHDAGFAYTDEARAKALAQPHDAAAQATAQAALAAVEGGNAAPGMAQPPYTPPVPPLMAVAAGYGLGTHPIWWEYLSVLCKECRAYAQVAAKQNELAGAARADRAGIGIGYRLVGNWPTRDSGFGSPDRLIADIGASLALAGYDDLQKLYEQAGDTTDAQQVAATRTALKQQANAYSQAWMADFSAGTFESY